VLTIACKLNDPVLSNAALVFMLGLPRFLVLFTFQCRERCSSSIRHRLFRNASNA
jgi:hypothetical protein